MKDKKFDAVRMMREIRDKLSEIYSKDPEAEKRDLEAIRGKYGIKGQKMRRRTSDNRAYLASVLRTSARISPRGTSDTLGTLAEIAISKRKNEYDWKKH